MTIPVRFFVAVTILAATISTGFGQDAVPQISIVQSGAEALKNDLRCMLGLTSETEQEQLDIVLDYLSEFQLGIDGSKPLRFDLIIEDQAVRTRPSFPIEDLDDFLSNLDAFGINVRKAGSDLFTLSNAFEGKMRYSRRLKYVWISEDQNDVPRSFKPEEGPVTLLKDGLDLVARITNSDDAKDVEKRRSGFQKLKAELIAAIKPIEEESAEDFKLRKTLSEHQINEFERFFVESGQLQIGWTTDEEKSEGRGQFLLKAIDGTGLADSLALLGTGPSMFAAVPSDESAVFSGRLNHPLDEMRIKHLTETFELLKQRGTARVDGYDLTDEQKDAQRKLVPALYDMLIAGAKDGVADMFVELVRNEQKLFTAVGGFKSPAAAMLVEAAPLFATGGVVEKVEPAIETVGDVAIHRMTARADSEAFTTLFGEDRSIYVGTSDSAVWYAVGADSLASLKSTIEAATGTPDEAAGSRILSLNLQLGPWLEMLNEINPASSPESEKIRTFALEAFAPGDAGLAAELKRDGDEVTGTMSIEPGVLRLLGKLIADFSAETLQ